ncbi:hypothetical protein [Lysobacter sp. OAE881]|uniref:hypothetical protein n=1 Tax=Lysobacter sp. OAE881 TaxID=2663813 RepID=UPI0033957353
MSAQAQRTITGDCARCGHPVHDLDGLDDAQRMALLAASSGPICVSYRTPARAASLAAIALTLVAGSALAESPSPLVADPATPSTPVEAGPLVEPLTTIVWVGGVSEPRSAQWVDDSSLPELPMIERASEADDTAR